MTKRGVIKLFKQLVWLVLICMFVAGAISAELPDFTDLVKENNAAVVNISTTQKVKKSRRIPPGMEIPEFPEGSPWSEFFRRFFDDEGRFGPEFNARSLGSGFIIDGNGYVITNYHVVKGADEIIVRLNDRRELSAEIKGYDERSDIALLKIDANDLPVVKIGNSKLLQVGEWVLAIGSPFGFDYSVTKGIISALGRALPNENYVPFIQTDVPINPGNSGGPLFNLKGEVVGINAQIYSGTGGFMGLSFAIPINFAIDVVNQLKDNGRVSRGYLGVLIQDVNRRLAESLGLKKPMGALVSRVLPDTPAADAGFKESDVIIEFNETKIVRSSDLPVVVGRTKIDKQVDVKIIREGKTKIIQVKIAELPTDDKVAIQGNKQKSNNTNRLALVVENLAFEQRRKLNVKDRGVVVKRVDRGPAYSAGIRRGDVLLMINNIDIKDTKHFNKLVKKLPTDKLLPILIQRRTGPEFLALKIPKDE